MISTRLVCSMPRARAVLSMCAALMLCGATARAAGLFVSSFGNGKVYLLSSETGAVVRTYADPHLLNPTGLALSSDGNVLYVANSNSDNDVVVFNARTGAYITTFANPVVSFASGVALRNNGQSLLVASFGPAVYQFNTTTGSSAFAFNVGALDAFDIELNANESAIYMATRDTGDSVIRKPLPSGTSTTFPFSAFDAPFGLALSSSETTLYVALANDGATNTNMIAVLDATTGLRTNTFTIAGPLGDMTGLDISADGSTLFASDSFNGLLYRVNSATGAATSLPTNAALDEPAYVLFTGDATLVPEPTLGITIAAATVCAIRRPRRTGTRTS